MRGIATKCALYATFLPCNYFLGFGPFLKISFNLFFTSAFDGVFARMTLPALLAVPVKPPRGTGVGALARVKPRPAFTVRLGVAAAVTAEDRKSVV